MWRKALNRLDKLSAKELNRQKYSDKNRRVIAMIPKTNAWSTTDLQISQLSKFRQLLLLIEANELSYCIKVSSSKCKSRAAALIFRGRILGCVYGNKRLAKQIFGKEAYQLMMTDAGCPTATIDADQLKEDFALAASSLFAGGTFEAESNKTLHENFEIAFCRLTQSCLPGCIVINNEDETLAAIVYMFNGKIIGIYSYKENEDWVSNSYERAVQFVVRNPKAKISSCILTARNVDEVRAMSFAMSDLNSRKESGPMSVTKFELAYALVSNYDNDDLLKMTSSYLISNPFIPGTVNPRLHTSNSVLDQ